MPNKRGIALVTQLSKVANRLYICEGLPDKCDAIKRFTGLLNLNQRFKKPLG